VIPELAQPAQIVTTKAPPNTGLRFVAVDLDGTLAEGIWTPTNPTSEIGTPRWENVSKAEKLRHQGWLVAIHTSRPWGDYGSIVDWCQFWEIPWDIVVCGKILAAAYIDDRAIHESSSNWTPRA
jgi:hypothetical protein